MDNLWRENKWKNRSKELYSDVSCKDAPVPPALPVPNCDCGKAAKVNQSMHPVTAARAYYSCGDTRPEEMCYFFQWIDGPEMVDPRILHFKQWTKMSYETFKRWVPPPPNPPPMTEEERKEAIAARMANPPLCDCGVPAEIMRSMPGCPFTPTFQCQKRNKYGYPLCDFSEYDYGLKSYWRESIGKEKGKEKEDFHAPVQKCHCGVVANYALVPSELGIGYYCAHMIGDDLKTRKCDFEFFYDKREVENEMKWRTLGGRYPNVLKSYLRGRKQDQREAARKRGLWPRPTGKGKEKYAEPREKKQRCGDERISGLGVVEVLMNTMKGR